MTARHTVNKISFLFAISSTLLTTSLPCFAAPQTEAPIKGFAQSFLLGAPLANATVTVLETGEKFQTDLAGNFGPILHPVGTPITLQLDKWGYKTTQTETVIVPPGGLTNPFENITFQVPTTESYFLLAHIMGAKIDDNSCHVAATVTGYHKVLHDLPQGEAGATVTLSPAVNEQPFYFGIFEKGPLKSRTNPFPQGLTKTSEDGGVAFFNLPPSDQPYTLSASKPGVKFTAAKFICRKGAFINISPPRGPMALT